MSLNTIDLPPVVIAGLYKKTLVADANDQPAPKKNPAAKKSRQEANAVPFLGKNLKNVLILVAYTDEVYLPDEQLNFLGKILNACGLNLADIAIVNTAAQAASFREIDDQLHPGTILVFGANPYEETLSPLPQQLNVYQINGLRVVQAPPLENMNNNDPVARQLKTGFWNCLKQLFNV